MKRLFSVAMLVALSFTLLPLSVAEDQNPYGGVRIAPPTPTEIILTIQKGNTVKKLSLNDLRAMKSEVVTINEPFVKKVQTFRAIPLSNLFNLAGIKGSDKVETAALNDYLYINTASNFISARGYLAYSRSGKAIGFDQGGPIRIIFPDKSRWSRFLDPWNWSLKSLKVK
jgi:hypothetical protein